MPILPQVTPRQTAPGDQEGLSCWRFDTSRSSMIIVSYNMSDYPRPHLATASPDFLSTADYPLRPTRTWGIMPQRQSVWRNCYFPHSFPVYRMQRLVSVALCLLALVLLSLMAFVLVQVTPWAHILGNSAAVMALNVKNPAHVTEHGRTKLEVGVGLGMTVRKLEDHPEYSDNAEEDYSEDEDYDDELDEEDDDDLILDDSYDDYDDEEEDEYNPVFDMKYFDFSLKEGENEANGEGGNEVKGEGEPADRQAASVSIAHPNTFTTPKVREKWTDLPKVSLINDYGVKVVEDGVVFSPETEALLKEPQGNDGALGKVQEELRTLQVKRLQDPTWDRCGRPKNQWVELVGGVAACARYRYPDVQLLMGEVLSFYLSRLLNVSHVPPPVLSLINPASPQWASVSNQMTQAGWGNASVVVLTPWIHGLVRDHMPSILLDTLLKNNALSIFEEEGLNRNILKKKPNNIQQHKFRKVNKALGKDVQFSVNQEALDFRENRLFKGATEKDLVQLLQWSDLLVFDYLTGNYDRVAYMQDAAEKEGRPQILSGTIHNLVRSEATGGLWLLDNESGLMDAYTLLYGSADASQSARFHSFHKRMLRSVCVFRRSTMESILGLIRLSEPHTFLINFVKTHEPLFAKLPDPLHNEVFVKYFPQRVREVYDWMNECVENVRKVTQTKYLRH